MEGESTTMELAQSDSSLEGIVDHYHNVYQLWRLSGKMLCDEVMEADIHQEILDCVKEHLWHKQLSVLPGAELRWSPAEIPRLNPKAEFNARNCATYDRFMGIKQDSCKEALAMVRDAHQ